MLLVSLVICTYRRLDMLRDAIYSLRELRKQDSTKYEVLVIDNDPEESAKPLVEKLRKEWNWSCMLRYIHEEQLGLNFARNRGIDESRGDIIAFFDDDVIVSNDWLLEIISCFERTGAVCVGGRALVMWDGEPDPVVRACERQLVAFDLGDQDIELRGRITPIGANMAFQRSIFANGIRFAHNLDRIGDCLLSGGDSELIWRINKPDKRIWYCATAINYHRAGGERLEQAYYIRLQYWVGISYAIADSNIHGKIYQIAHALARMSKAMLVEVPRWLQGMFSHNLAKSLLAKCAIAKQLGYLKETLSISIGDA